MLRTRQRWVWQNHGRVYLYYHSALVRIDMGEIERAAELGDYKALTDGIAFLQVI